MNTNRFKQRKEEFNQALSRLLAALNQPEDEFTRDAAIQRFEFTYELAWKTLKLYLESKDIDVRNARDTLKAAFEQGLIQDGDGWSQLHQQRNLTSHTYDEKLAEDVYQFLKQKGASLFVALQTYLQSVDKL